MRISDWSSDVCSSDLHTGNANAYTNSTWLLSRREVEALEGPPPPPNVKPGTLSGRRQAKVEPVELDRDVFGDGTVKILHANGHTAGHQVLQVKLRSEEHTSELQ